jgi:hypothetical protein
MREGSTSGGFFSSFEEAERLLGPDAARWIRGRAERQLTESERMSLRGALEPILRDLRVSGAIVPDVLERAWDDDEDAVCAYISAGGTGSGSTGVRLRLGYEPAERLVDLADQVQEWEVEELAVAGRSATWPECPVHPNSHPLEPAGHEQAGHDRAAVWRCPSTHEIIASIGGLQAG